MPLGVAGKFSLECYVGETVTHSFEVEASLTSSIVGWTFVMTIKDDDVAPTFTKTISGTIVDAANRLFEVVVPAATTSTIKVNVHKHDVWRTNAGFEWVLNDGNYTVKTERRVTPP